MAEFEASNPDYAALVARILGLQTFMVALGVRLDEVSPGRCTLALDCRPDHLQHGGSVHGGVLGALADNAAGAAAATLLPVGFAVVTVEYKINFLAPARGERLLARAEVIRPGRAISVARTDVFALAGERQTLCATAMVTLSPMALPAA